MSGVNGESFNFHLCVTILNLKRSCRSLCCSAVWAAHASRVLVLASRRNNLSWNCNPAEPSMRLGKIRDRGTRALSKLDMSRTPKFRS